jgi:hypothetical protein
VADCLTLQFEEPSDQSFSGLVLQHLPAAFQSIREHQIKDPFCSDLYQKIKQKYSAVRNFRLLNDTIVYFPPRTKSRRYLVPQGLRAMILDYFHDSTLSARLRVAKNLHRVSKVFYWPGIRPDVVKYVRQCDVCQRAKPAQNTQVGFHNSRIVTKPMERIFIEFVGPIVRSRQGNLALLVVLDWFSKFVRMYPVRKKTSSAVVDCFVGKYFPSIGIPNYIVSDNAAVFKSCLF